MIAVIFIGALAVISFLDLRHRLIPDAITIPGAVLGVALSFHSTQPTPLDSILGFVAGGGALLVPAIIYRFVTGVEGIGGGDIKLLAMIGTFLGWRAIPSIMFFGSLGVSVFGMIHLLIHETDEKYAFPFGAFLCWAAIGHMIF